MLFKNCHLGRLEYISDEQGWLLDWIYSPLGLLRKQVVENIDNQSSVYLIQVFEFAVPWVSCFWLQ